MESSPGARYWDEVGASWRDKRRQALWRAHSDAVNIDWLTCRLPEARVGRILKTDLFDEALARVHDLQQVVRRGVRRAVGVAEYTRCRDGEQTRYPDE